MKISQLLQWRYIFLDANCEMDPLLMEHHVLPVLMSDNTAYWKIDWPAITYHYIRIISSACMASWFAVVAS